MTKPAFLSINEVNIYLKPIFTYLSIFLFQVAAVLLFSGQFFCFRHLNDSFFDIPKFLFSLIGEKKVNLSFLKKKRNPVLSTPFGKYGFKLTF